MFAQRTLAHVLSLLVLCFAEPTFASSRLNGKWQGTGRGHFLQSLVNAPPKIEGGIYDTNCAFSFKIEQSGNYLRITQFKLENTSIYPATSRKIASPGTSRTFFVQGNSLFDNGTFVGTLAPDAIRLEFKFFDARTIESFSLMPNNTIAYSFFQSTITNHYAPQSFYTEESVRGIALAN